MEKEELWNIYVSKNPLFLKGPINFTANGLRKFFDQTYDMGEKNGLEKNSKPNNYPNKNDFGDIFGSMFGGKDPFGGNNSFSK
jgi:hypothetical protein